MSEGQLMTKTMIPCVGEDCSRSFIDEAAFQTHVGTVHPELDAARTYTKDQGKQAAKAGAATPAGSFQIRNATDLKKAISGVANAKDPAAAKAHIIKRAKALGLDRAIPKDWLTENAELAQLLRHELECPKCPRYFKDEAAYLDHAEAVHTFDDIRQMVAEELTEFFGKQTDDYKTSIYVYLVDIADDWVVFQASQGSDQDLYKVSYSVVDGDVTFGTPVEVVRRTVYDPVGPDDNDDDVYTGVLDPDNN